VPIAQATGSVASVSNNGPSVEFGVLARSNITHGTSFISIGEAQIDLHSGALRLTHALDFDLSPGTDVGGSPALVYNSDRYLPVIKITMATDPELPLPDSVTLDWELNGETQDSITFSDLTFEPGDTIVFALQCNSVPESGVIEWVIRATATYDDETTFEATLAGSENVTAPAPDNGLGAGWGIDGIDRLAFADYGITWITGAGDRRLFVHQSSVDTYSDGEYINPTGEFGKLIQNDDFSFTYFAYDGTVRHFDERGLMIKVVDLHDLERTYEYYEESGYLESIEAPDFSDTTIAISAPGQFTITAPGGRTLAMAGGALSDFDGTTRTISGGTLVSGDQWEPFEATFSYLWDRLAGMDQGTASTYVIRSVMVNGLGTPVLLENESIALLTDFYEHETTYEFDLDGHLITEKSHNGALQTWTYDDEGFVASYTDDSLNKTTYLYAGPDLISQSDTDGNSWQYAYDGPYHNITSETSYPAAGRMEVFANIYDSDTGDLLTRTAHFGTDVAATTEYVWDHGLLESATDPLDNVTEYFYDAHRRLTTVVLNGEQTTGYTYDANGNYNRITTVANVVDYDYGNTNRVLSEKTFERNGTTLAYAMSYVYFAAGHTFQVIDGEGNKTISAYDDAGRLTHQEIRDDQDVLAFKEDWAYNYAGHLKLYTDGEGNETRYEVDADGNVTSREIRDAQDEVDFVEYLIYNVPGDVTSEIDANGNITTYTRDTHSRVTHREVRNASNVIVEFESWTYDSVGNLATHTDALGTITMYEYDTHRHLAQTAVYDNQNNMLRVETWGFNSLGDLSIYSDPNGFITNYQRDGAGRLLGQENLGYFGMLVRDEDWEFDLVGNMISNTDGNGNQTFFEHDALGNVIHQETQDEAGVVFREDDWEFDLAGNLKSHTDGEGNKTLYVRDALGNVLHQETQDEDGYVDFEEDWDYDLANQLKSRTDGAGNKTIYDRDALGNVVHQETQDENEEVDHEEDWDFDLAGRLQSRTDGEDNKTIYVRDALGNVTHQETQDEDEVVVSEEDADFDLAGNLVSRTDGEDNKTIFVHDALGNVVHQETQDENGVVFMAEGWDYDLAGNLISHTDGVGNTTFFEHDELGNVIHQETQDENEVVVSEEDWAYDPAGNLISRIDGEGNETFYVHDPLGNVIYQQTQSENGVASMEGWDFDFAGNLISHMNGAGSWTIFEHDPFGNVIHQQTGDDSDEDWIYDRAGNLISRTDGEGNQTIYEHDALGNVIHQQIQDEDGIVAAKEDADFDLAGNLISRTDGEDNKTIFDHDALGNVVHQETQNENGIVFSAEGWDYNLAGNLVSRTDGEGNTTFFEHDALGNVVHQETQDENEEVASEDDREYDLTGNLESYTDADGNETTYERDALGRTTHEETRDANNALLHEQDWTYDLAGQLLEHTDEFGFVYAYEYDGAGRVLHLMVHDDAENLVNEEFWEYDDAGNEISHTDHDGNVTDSEHDALGRVIHQEVHDDQNTLLSVEDWTFNGVGNVLAHDDTLGRDSHFTHDALGRITSATAAYGTTAQATTQYEYDLVGNVIRLTDPAGNETTFEYDALGNKTSMTDALDHTATFVYDNAGRMESATDRNGRRRDFTYDAVGRLLTETWYNAASSLTETLEYTYDLAGRLLTAENSAGAYAFTYNALGQIIEVEEPNGVSLTFEYDARGNRTLMEDSLGGTTTSDFDAHNRLVSRVFTQSGQPTLRTDFVYDWAGRVAKEINYCDADGTQLVSTSEHIYDAKGRLIELVHRDAGADTIAAYEYEYNAAGQLIAQTDHGVTTNYDYDAQGQLIDDDAHTYTYDAAGNRPNEDESAVVNNQLANYGVWNFTYDDEGNLTKKSLGSTDDTWLYGYDNANHLVSATLWTEDPSYPGTAVLQREAEYQYDVFGNRIAKTVDMDGVGAMDPFEQRYVLDGWNSAKSSPIGLENFDVIADLNETGSLTTRYVRGDAVDQLIGRIDVDQSSNAYWYLVDHLGSLRDVIDETGVVKDAIAYDGFGNITSETEDDFGGRYKWTAREYDVETELQYNRARFYDAATGRWISQDPLGFDAGDSNLYRYVHNEPTNRTDPSGKLVNPGLYATYAAYKDAVAIENWSNGNYQKQGLKFRPPDEKPVPIEAWRAARSEHDEAILRSRKQELEVSICWAKVASAGYLGDEKLIKSLETTYGLKEIERVNNPTTALQALVLQDSKGNIVISYGGTDMSKDWAYDLFVDAAQGTGYVTAQYHEAIQLAQKYKTIAKEKGTKLATTGHSLGGGLAAASGIVTKSPTVSFNGAGVHAFTIEGYGGKLSDGDRLITAYRVRFEPLSELQDARGNIIGWLMPNGNGKLIRLESDIGLKTLIGARHLMDPLIERWERELLQVELKLGLIEMGKRHDKNR